MFEKTTNFFVGANGNKGLLERSGIITALMTTIYVVIEGTTKNGIAQELLVHKASLMIMWSTALTVLVGNRSKRM